MNIHWSNQIITTAILLGVAALSVNSSEQKPIITYQQNFTPNVYTFENYHSDQFPSRCDCGIARRCSAPCKTIDLL
ncbi:MAG: hypothetical protein OCD01_11745 [Fibrobacterales bacterium]